MFTTKTKIDVEVQKELSKRIYLGSLISLIVGAVGLAVYIVLGTIFENYWLDLLLVFAIPFGFGLVFIITIKKLMKKVEDINQLNEYVFEEVFVNVSTIRNGESVGTAKIYYKDLVKSKETQNYIYMYINKSAALPVKKENLTQDELIVLRSLLKLELLPEQFKGN